VANAEPARVRHWRRRSQPLLSCHRPRHRRVLEFTNSVDAARLAELGTSCPDHFLRTKIKPLYVDWNPPRRVVRGAAGKSWERGLTRLPRRLPGYYESCKHPDRAHGATPTPRSSLSRAGADRLGQE